MMESLDCRTLDNPGSFYRPNRSTIRGIPVQRLVRSPGMVVIQIRREQSLEVTLVKDNDVIETFPAKAADHSLHIGVLPR